MLLPDGKLFLSWSDLTSYTRTYHVSRNNPKSSDENDGTEERPFRTINHAAQIVKPGERVFIHAGIYRELVRPRLSGEGQNRMIAYEAAPGEKVIVSGSRVIPAKWELSIDANGIQGTPGTPDQLSIQLGFPANIYSKQLWMITLPDSLFENGYFPLRIPNVTNDDFDVMTWAARWKGRFPYDAPRGLLFEDGRRMTQLFAYEDLVRIPGSFWIASDGKTVHIHPFRKTNPNDHLFEIAVQPHIIQPQTLGLNFIRISGLILEHCANGFTRAGVAALFTMGGSHWIIEGNTVRHVNSVGIDAGGRAYEGKNAPKQTTPILGHNIIRRNHIYDCGTAGMRGLGISQALVENNEIVDCGWQDVEFHWEVAGIKLLGCRGTIVRNNYVARIQGGDAIWLDFANQNSRVTGNVMHDITTVQGAVFIEASQQMNMVDNNFLWNINGQGVRLADTDSCIVAHNFFGYVSEELAACKVATDRSLGGRKLTSIGNRIMNNIVVDQGKPILFEDSNNITDYNVYVSTKTGQTAKKDAGLHSESINGDIKFDDNNLRLIWNTESKLPLVPLLKNCELDFFRNKRTQVQNIPGPFLKLTNKTKIQLVIPVHSKQIAE